MYIEIFLVITGCTRGVGFCYAKELAKRNMNLILMGRNEQRISEISELLLRDHPDIKIEILDIDFSRTEDFSKKIIESLDGKDIGILVNNVGVILPFPMYFNEVRYYSCSYRKSPMLYKKVAQNNQGAYYPK